jgi:hypothetical protein
VTPCIWYVTDISEQRIASSLRGVSSFLSCSCSEQFSRSSMTLCRTIRRYSQQNINFEAGSKCYSLNFLTLHHVSCLKSMLQISEAVAIVRNSLNPKRRLPTEEVRSVDDQVLNEVDQYVRGHDLLVQLPGATLNLSPRLLDHNEITANLKFNDRQGKDVTVNEGNSIWRIVSTLARTKFFTSSVQSLGLMQAPIQLPVGTICC